MGRITAAEAVPHNKNRRRLPYRSFASATKICRFDGRPAWQSKRRQHTLKPEINGMKGPAERRHRRRCGEPDRTCDFNQAYGPMRPMPGNTILAFTADGEAQLFRIRRREDL